MIERDTDDAARAPRISSFEHKNFEARTLNAGPLGLGSRRGALSS